MAKKFEVITNVQAIPVGLLYSDPEENWGRKDSKISGEAELKMLRKSLAELGWKPGDRIECTKMSAEQVIKYHALLQAEHVIHKTKAENPTATDREKQFLRIWEMYYCDTKGQVKKPEYLVLSGNQRFSQVIDASVDRWNAVKKHGWGTYGIEEPEGSEGVNPSACPEECVIKNVPMTVTVYASLSEQIEAQAAENMLKTVGSLEPTRLDMAVAGAKLLELDNAKRGHPFLMKEADLARKLSLTKRGMVQDVHRIVAVNYYGGPELDYLNRCCIKNGLDENALQWGWKLGSNGDVKSRSIRMINRMDPAWVHAEQSKMLSNGKNASHADWPLPCTKAEFITYFGEKGTEEERAGRLNYAELEAGATKFGADVLNDYINGAKSGNLDEFWAKYGDFAQVLNLAVKLATQVGHELLEVALAGATTNANPSGVVEEWIALRDMPVQAKLTQEPLLIN